MEFGTSACWPKTDLRKCRPPTYHVLFNSYSQLAPATEHVNVRRRSSHAWRTACHRRTKGNINSSGPNRRCPIDSAGGGSGSLAHAAITEKSDVTLPPLHAALVSDPELTASIKESCQVLENGGREVEHRELPNWICRVQTAAYNAAYMLVAKTTRNESGLQQRVQELEALLRRERASADLRGDETPSATRGLDQEAIQQNPAEDHTAQVHSVQDIGGPHTQTASRTDLSHQVGLVSLSVGGDPRYIGPSSGYFFTKLLSSAGKRREGHLPRSDEQGISSWQQYERDVAMKAFQSTPCSLPTDKNSVRELSDAYFRTIHLVYPFLHKPTHQRLIDHVYDTPEPSHAARFQVTMVLSISAIILSRRSRVDLPGAGWCAAALEHFAHVQVEGSVHGLQCLILLLIYAMHSSSSRFNAWHINYQCLAMVLDLGLQRDPPETASLSQFQREMRTRIFMSVYSLDRKLATMMGRPIGLRDEACDLRVRDAATETVSMN
jgi:hypothetical protein